MMVWGGKGVGVRIRRQVLCNTKDENSIPFVQSVGGRGDK
jgi:hypothetical protein